MDNENIWNILSLCSNTFDVIQARAVSGEGAIAPPTETYQSNFSHHDIVYNLENGIRDIRPFCHPLFCHSSIVKYFISLTVVNP